MAFQDILEEQRWIVSEQQAIRSDLQSLVKKIENSFKQEMNRIVARLDACDARMSKVSGITDTGALRETTRTKASYPDAHYGMQMYGYPNIGHPGTGSHMAGRQPTPAKLPWSEKAIATKLTTKIPPFPLTAGVQPVSPEPHPVSDDLVRVIHRVCDGGTLGLEVRPSKRSFATGMEVVRLDEHGAIAAFNRLAGNNSPKRIIVGDLIVAVNGAKEPTEMMTELNERSTVELLFTHGCKHEETTNEKTPWADITSDDDECP